MQIILFAVATPIYIIILYQLLEYAAWIRIIVADNTISSLNFVTIMGATMRYQVGAQTFYTYTDLFQHVGAARIFFSYVDDIEIYFDIPGQGPIQFVTFCTGFQAIIIFSAIIFFTPHSLDKSTSKGIWKRKMASLFWSSLIFYIVNIVRMWIQLYLYYTGSNWNDIHYSISAASSFIAAIIIVLMHKILPEFVISIVWTGIEIKKRYFPNLGYKAPATASPGAAAQDEQKEKKSQANEK